MKKTDVLIMIIRQILVLALGESLLLVQSTRTRDA